MAGFLISFSARNAASLSTKSADLQNYVSPTVNILWPRITLVASITSGDSAVILLIATALFVLKCVLALKAISVYGVTACVMLSAMGKAVSVTLVH